MTARGVRVRRLTYRQIEPHGWTGSGLSPANIVVVLARTEPLLPARWRWGIDVIEAATLTLFSITRTAVRAVGVPLLPLAPLLQIDTRGGAAW